MNSRSDLYGAGIFTTIRVIDGKPWLWEKHLRRLEHDAAALGIGLTLISEEVSILERLERRIKGMDLISGRARITVSDKRDSELWPGTARGASTALSIQTGVLKELPRPFRLGLSPHRVNSTSPLAGHKTCNYLEQTMAIGSARDHGYDDAVRLNEHGQVTSACMANIFWLKDDRLFTPALSTGCMPGTTRAFVLENLVVIEVDSEIDELRDADAIFLTSAGIGVVAVDEFAGRPLPMRDHAILDLVPG